MKQIQLVFYLSLLSVLSFGQEVLTLDTCLSRAVKNYPLIQNELYIQQRTNLNVKSMNTGYLPSINIIGQATWQSEVTNLDIDVPFLTEPLTDLPQDQYKIAADISQVIWDGGNISNHKKLEHKRAYAEQQKLKVDIYAFKEEVVKLYFSLLVLQKQEEVITVKKWQIRERLKELESAVENGVILPAQMNMLLAENISVEQKILDIDYEIEAVQSILEFFMGENIPEFANILLPSPDISSDITIQRPEINYFQALKGQTEMSSDLLKTTHMPKIMAFSQVGYGRPGLNMLSAKFGPYAIVGAKIVWNPWDWNRTKYQREALVVQQQMLNVQESQFVFIQKAQANAQLQRIEKLQKMIEKDEELLVLRQSITASYSSQLQNGVVTSGEYIIVLNDEQTARLNLSMHEILLSKARVEYQIIVGKLTE